MKRSFTEITSEIKSYLALYNSNKKMLSANSTTELSGEQNQHMQNFRHDSHDDEDSEHRRKVFDEESRSVYVGHLPETTTYYDLCKAANPFGSLELCRFVPKKRCAFLNFVDINSAKQMMQKYSDSCVPRPEDDPGENVLHILGKPVRLSWSRTNDLSPEIKNAIDEFQATRHLFVYYGACMKPSSTGFSNQGSQAYQNPGFRGQNSSPMTIPELESVFRKFGQIENVVIKHKKHIAFVNMTSINAALHAYKASLPPEEAEKVHISEFQTHRSFEGSGQTLNQSSSDGLFIRGERLVVKFSNDNDQNYSSGFNDPRNQSGALFSPNPFAKNSGNGNFNSGFNQAGNSYGQTSNYGPTFEPPLPKGWLESFDPATGCKYYFNSDLQITQWEHPVTNKASPPNKTPPFAKNSTSDQGNSAVNPSGEGRTNSRAIIMSNLPQNTTYSQVCGIARQHGMIESCRLHTTQQAKDSGSVVNNVAFVNFVDPTSAASLFYQAQQSPIVLDGQQLKIGWAKEVPIKPYILYAIQSQGANRSLFLSNLTDVTISEQQIRDALTEISGSGRDCIESVILRPQDKPFGFVNFIDIISAKKVVEYVNGDGGGSLQINGNELQVSYVDMRKKLEKSHQRNMSVAARAGFVSGQGNNGQNITTDERCRSVIISNFPDATTYADIAALGRPYGAIESLHLSPEKNHAFINFVSSDSASHFVSSAKANTRGFDSNASEINGNKGLSNFEVKGQKVRVGYGKSVPMRSDIVNALKFEGASRSVYVGGIPEGTTEDMLKSLFDPITNGVYESIVVHREKPFAFVNFTSIHTAKKVVDHCRINPVHLDGKDLKVSYAK